MKYRLLDRGRRGPPDHAQRLQGGRGRPGLRRLERHDDAVHAHPRRPRRADPGERGRRRGRGDRRDRHPARPAGRLRRPDDDVPRAPGPPPRRARALRRPVPRRRCGSPASRREGRLTTAAAHTDELIPLDIADGVPCNVIHVRGRRQADEGAGAARPRRRRAHRDLAPADAAHARRGARRRRLRRLDGDLAGEHGRPEQHVDARPGARCSTTRVAVKKVVELTGRGLDPGDHALPGLDELHDVRLRRARPGGAHDRRQRGVAAPGRAAGREAQAQVRRAARLAADSATSTRSGASATRRGSCRRLRHRVLQALAAQVRQRRLQGVELHVRRRRPDAVDARAAQRRDARVDQGRVRPRAADVLQADLQVRRSSGTSSRSRAGPELPDELRRAGAADRRALLVHHRRAQQLLRAREPAADVRLVRAARARAATRCTSCPATATSTCSSASTPTRTGTRSSSASWTSRNEPRGGRARRAAEPTSAGEWTSITLFSTLHWWGPLVMRPLFAVTRAVPKTLAQMDSLSFISFASWSLVRDIPYNGTPQRTRRLRYAAPLLRGPLQRQLGAVHRLVRAHPDDGDEDLLGQLARVPGAAARPVRFRRSSATTRSTSATTTAPIRTRPSRRSARRSSSSGAWTCSPTARGSCTEATFAAPGTRSSRKRARPMRSTNVTGRTYALMVLTPIRPGAADALRAYRRASARARWRGWRARTSRAADRRRHAA